MSLTTTTTTSTVDALRARGVAGHVAVKLARCSAPDLIGAWCAYAERHPSMPPGALVNAVRFGEPPPAEPRSPVSLAAQRDYAEQVKAWLRTHLPECCDEQGAPHPAAIAAVIKLHHRYGRGSLTARAHGAVIRAAVKAAERSSASGEEGGERGGDA